MEICKLKPAIATQIWGGTYFKKFNKGLNLDRVSECWELSLRPNMESIIDSGVNKGQKITDVITKADIGPIQDNFPFFPLLIKLIDAKENLSVQVHPSDDYALKNENSFGKSEMWHIVSHEDNACIYVGFNKDYSLEEVKKALNEGTILNLLNKYKVENGDTFIINPGTIHAIGAGVRLIEIQQNSDLTYRLYDYNRVDKNGNHRELHIDKALKVIDLKQYHKHESNNNLLARNKYFTVMVKDLAIDNFIKANKDSFSYVNFIDAEGTINDLKINKFESVFIPCNKEAFLNGKGKYIYVTLEKNL